MKTKKEEKMLQKRKKITVQDNSPIKENRKRGHKL